MEEDSCHSPSLRSQSHRTGIPKSSQPCISLWLPVHLQLQDPLASEWKFWDWAPQHPVPSVISQDTLAHLPKEEKSFLEKSTPFSSLLRRAKLILPGHLLCAPHA